MNALNAYNALNANVSGMKKSSEKLSSGYRINRAGDDAAGLAISEKMRSQIRGLNQAVRNSQDGINMVQTFEGAAQETHSILQRMKELATESANGTYDNATDRAAIQLEFDQLNDELNQIADTDFNGTIVLNGGVMADGTVAQNGEFNYANGYTESVIGKLATDISADEAHNLADQSFYDKYEADAVWNALGVDVKDVQDLNVTFQFDGERWVADTVTYAKDINDENGNLLHKAGDIVEGARAAGLEAREVERANANGQGGFEVIAGKDAYTSKDVVATNVIFDEMKPIPKKGDTVTVQFQNSKETTYAPKNIGIDECYEDGDVAFQMTADAAKPTFVPATLVDKVHVKLGAGVTDENMTKEIADALKELDECGIKATFTDGRTKTFAFGDATTPSLIELDANTGKVTLKSSGMELATITIDNIDANNPRVDDTATAVTTVAGSGEALGLDADKALALIKGLGLDKPEADTATTTGIKFTAKAGGSTGVDREFEYTDADGNTQEITLKTLRDTYGATLSANIGNYADNDNFTINYTNPVKAQSGADNKFTGDVEFGINVKSYNFADMSKLTVHSVATPEKATMASQVAEKGVTAANAFKNSTARMTYTDNITLQTGARTKDAVNFNFSYNTDGSADMGNLVANLDLSSRSTGLNTANLSLANADDANYAIDQIDKAINKTSMVRATFGSIQNRLEHKITNLTTTAENLTEAESSIRDTDMASEMMNYTKYNILQQAAQSMLAQANQQPQSILQLLG